MRCSTNASCSTTGSRRLRLNARVVDALISAAAPGLRLGAVAVRRRLCSLYCSGDDPQSTRLEVQASVLTVRRFARSRSSAHKSSFFTRRTICKSMSWSRGLRASRPAISILLIFQLIKYFMKKSFGFFLLEDSASPSPSFPFLFSPSPSQ